MKFWTVKKTQNADKEEWCVEGDPPAGWCDPLPPSEKGNVWESDCNEGDSAAMDTSAAVEASTPAVFSVDEAILGNWSRRGRFYPGTIKAVSLSLDGAWLYSVQYQDGDFEVNVPESMLRPASLQQSLGDFDATRVFSPGDQVEGNWRGLGKVYPGIIVGRTAGDNGTFVYSVRYADGDMESDVPPRRIRGLESRPSRKRPKIDWSNR